MFHHSTPEGLSKQLRTRRNRGYATAPNISRKQRVQTPDTDLTRGSASARPSSPPSVAGQESPILEEYTRNQTHEQPSSVNSNPIPETLSPSGQSRRPGSTASVESTRPSHASANSCSSGPSLVDQSHRSWKGRPRTSRRQTIVGHRERTEEKLDSAQDDRYNRTKCSRCRQYFDATNRRTCGDWDSSRAICSGCLLNPDLFPPGHKFRQEEDEAPSAAASPSQVVSIRSKSCRPPAHPTQYQCNYCKDTLATRYFCESCNIDLCKVCLTIHPPEHPVKELQTDPPASSGQPSGYVLGEVSESEAVPDDSLNWDELDTDDSDDQRKLDMQRQGQRGPKERSQQRQSLAHQRMPLTMLEKIPEQVLLAKLLEQSGDTVTFDREDVIKVVKHIQESRRRPTRTESADGGLPPLLWHDDARPSTKRSSVAQSLGTGEVGCEVSMRDSISENSDDQEQAPDRGTHARKRGGLRDLLKFDVPRSKPKRHDRIRQNRRWTREDKRQLRKLKREGWDNYHIAAELNRSPSAIFQQWAKQK